MIRVIALNIALCTSVCWCAERPADVQGWGKIKWGMSVVDAKLEYQGQAQDSKQVPGPNFPYIEKLVIPRLSVGPVAMSAGIEVPRGGKTIQRVTLVLDAPVDASTSVRSSAYGTLRASLIQKYGAPSSDDRVVDDGTVKRTVLWSFPSTSISLTWEETPRFAIGFVAIFYQAVYHKTLDSL